MPYFDFNATTPLSPAAREAWLKAVDESWHNPSSAHRAGTRVKILLQHARENLATVIDCDSERIVFTSGATESAHAIARHLANSLPEGKKGAINPTEHLCVIDAVRANWRSDQLEWLKVDGEGRVDMADLRSRLATGDIGAVWTMAVNNETGVLQPWADIAKACREAGVSYVCDAAQWWGKVAGDGLAQADWVIAAGHKFGAPKRSSFLLRPRSEENFQVRPGRATEGKSHGGTQDFPTIASTVSALISCERQFVMLESDRVQLRDRFEQNLLRRLPGTQILGAGVERLWNTVAAIMPHGENHRWVTLLDKRGIEVSTGSACSSGSESPSHVLAAMGVPGDAMRRVIRISAGWTTKPEDWDTLLEALVAVADELKPADNVISI